MLGFVTGKLQDLGDGLANREPEDEVVRDGFVVQREVERYCVQFNEALRSVVLVAEIINEPLSILKQQVRSLSIVEEKINGDNVIFRM